MSTPIDQLKTPKIGRLSEAQRIDFGELSHYRPLIGDGDTSIRTGMQICEPGYQTAMHWHPYLELLFIVEGTAEAWLQGQEDAPTVLQAGDCIALPPNIPHAFRTVGEHRMRLLGIHSNPDRIVNYLDQQSDDNGYPVLSS